MARILIVDDEAQIRELLRKALASDGYEVTSVPTAEQALELIFKEPFDLLLLDIRLSKESGIAILKKVREYQKDLPVVIYSGVLTAEMEKEARAAGANGILSKDMDILKLAEELGKIIKANKRPFPRPAERKEKTVLIVDDEEGIRRVVREFLKRRGYNILEAGSGEEALRVIRSGGISVVLLDINMPGIDGLTTLAKLKEINPSLGVIMTTAVTDNEKVKKAIDLGASGYVLKPFDFLYLELIIKGF